MDFNQNHFELFGLPAAYAIDGDRLDKAYRDIQAEIHPDRFAHAGDAEKRLSMQWATRVNEAYQTLRKPFERARYLLQMHGVDAMDANNTTMPSDFLMQQMAWREALADALASADLAALHALEQELRVHARDLQDELALGIDQRQDWLAASETLRKLRFMDKLLEEIDSALETLE
jgi:molecular chaperone HscB